jgi:hypothetical protein
VNSTNQDQIGDYVAGVRAALVGLPESTLEELLEDLPEHLAEVLAEDQGTLIERLGTPEAYAAELRATAGFVGGFPDPPPSTWVPFTEARNNVVQVLRMMDVRIGPVIGYERASEFLRLLRPAWWVLRGYLAAMVIAFISGDNGGNLGLLPRLSGSELVAVILLATCVIVSILIGKRTASLSKWPRYALWSGTALLSLFAIGGFLDTDSSARNSYYNDVSSYDANPFSNVQDVYVYDSQGRLVPGARLFDQDGSPIQLGNSWCSDPDTGESLRTRSMGYPYCPERAPFGTPPSASRVSPSEAPPTQTGTGAAPAASASPSDPVERLEPEPTVSGSPSPARSAIR